MAQTDSFLANVGSDPRLLDQVALWPRAFGPRRDNMAASLAAESRLCQAKVGIFLRQKWGFFFTKAHKELELIDDSSIVFRQFWNYNCNYTK